MIYPCQSKGEVRKYAQHESILYQYVSAYAFSQEDGSALP